ncbi:hypothetical protein [Mitsuaria sp. 7]|uniref:hypothetical protein n=1 Tax=Mitsuaria sp. 7 TaxID=1658665 RepID=UPI0012FA8B3B|nr:hypothetical protein [Mitsuaria sp. 7]
MSIKPEDLLKIANEQSRQDGEPWRRSAISRAYYASFHRCLAWERGLARRGKAPKQGGIHQRLIDRLGAPSGVCTLKQKSQSIDLHRLLIRQKDQRVIADYRLRRSVSETDLKEQLRDARLLFKTCGS